MVIVVCTNGYTSISNVVKCHFSSEWSSQAVIFWHSLLNSIDNMPTLLHSVGVFKCNHCASILYVRVSKVGTGPCTRSTLYLAHSEILKL